MKNFLTQKEINQFKKDGAILIQGKFDLNWIEKLKTGIDKDKIGRASCRERV